MGESMYVKGAFYNTCLEVKLNTNAYWKFVQGECWITSLVIKICMYMHIPGTVYTVQTCLPFYNFLTYKYYRQSQM